MLTRSRKEIRSKRSTTRRSRSLSLSEIKKHINHFEWVPIPNTQENDILISPAKIEDKYMFLYFLKRFWMQPLVRRYFIHKYRPDIDYNLVKFDWKDPFYKEKAKFIERKIRDSHSSPTKDWIIDIAEQLEEGGGHWTSLKFENGVLEYMDSDPFYYGSSSPSSENKKSFHKLVKAIPNPIEIYGNTNKIRSVYNAEKSIQNIHKKDIFCQSWSLFFLTISHLYPALSKRLHFQEKSPVLHSDIDAQFANFPKFLENYKVLLDIWITLLEKDKGLREIVKDSQWAHWTPKAIVDSLANIRRYISKNEDRFKTDMETQEDMFCIVEEELGDYFVKK